MLDTDVVVAAMRSPGGASAALLRELDAGRASFGLSVCLALEYEAKCCLPVHYQAAGITGEQAEAFVTYLLSRAQPVQIHYQWRPQLRDPGDEMVLEAAVNWCADALVSFNQRDFGDAPARFGIQLLAPGAALQQLRRNAGRI